jgi:hypothetical protein
MSTVPDLYELAFMPGCFKCPTCGFQLSKQTICAASGNIGITQANKESEPCPNDGSWLEPVTYREQLEAYAARLTEEFDTRDQLQARIGELEAELEGLQNIVAAQKIQFYRLRSDLEDTQEALRKAAFSLKDAGCYAASDTAYAALNLSVPAVKGEGNER